MANSTWIQATNSVLNLAQLPICQSEAAFNAGQLPKYQNAAKYKVDFAHRHLTLRVRTAFDNCRFQLPIQAGTTDYVLDTGINAESIKYHSWYNITAGSAYAQHLQFMLYEDYMDMWPDQTQVQQQPPCYVVQLPYDRSLDYPVGAFAPMPRVRIYPIPDDSYILEYQAALSAAPLTVATSQILWTQDYEHGLWAWAWNFLEVDLAEGREVQLEAMVDQVVTRIKLASQPAEEVRKGVRMMKMNNRRRSGWRRGGGGYFG